MAVKRDADVVVVGAGPVGLLAAIAAKTAGLDVSVYDAGQRTAAHSYALVLHAATLSLLDRFGLAAECVATGRVVSKLAVYEGGGRFEELDFSRLPGPYPHVVVLPQSRLESILEAALEKLSVHVAWDHRVQGFESSPDGIRLSVARLDKVSTGYPIAHTEVVVDKMLEASARFVVAADGYDSFVRRRLSIEFTDQGHGQIYSVFQFETDAGMPIEGRLLLMGDRIGAYWPLPGGRCRFGFPIGGSEEHRPDAARLRELLAAWAPWFRGAVGAIEWSAVALFDRKLAASFGSDRIWMAGDAAHLTGPLGGQSMNVGLREAVQLAEGIASALHAGATMEPLHAYGVSRMQEWKQLFGAGVPFASRRALLLPCIPASGDDLTVLLKQLNS